MSAAVKSSRLCAETSASGCGTDAHLVVRIFRGLGGPRWGNTGHDLIGYDYRMSNVAAAIGLAQAGIETRPVFYPVHTMGLHTHRFAQKAVAEDLAARGLNLPSRPDMGDEDFELVCRAVEGFY